MLDKSLPYFDMLMVCPWRAAQKAQPAALPAGFRYALYRPGDIDNWAAIETSVGEFDGEDAARAYFERVFLPQEDELRKRMCFIEAEGEKVATATAWRFEQDGAFCPALHWVAVRPEWQDRGLGRAVVGRALSLCAALDPEKPVCLHTQTWSHKAVGIYQQFGFMLALDGEYLGYKNRPQEALAALNGVMRPDRYRILADTAVHLKDIV